MNAFNHMASFLNRTTNKLISKQEYEVFCKEYIFDQIKGKRFGQAFCERFDIVNDMVMQLLIDEDIAREMIEENYIK